GHVRSGTALRCSCTCGGGRRGRNRRSSLTSFDDDVGELLGVGKAAERVDRELELLASGDWRLADLAGDDLDILLIDSGHNVSRAEAKSREPFGVEPDPQAIVALAEI